MKPDDFLKSADDLLKLNRGRPTQVNLRRACSAVYYAMFHALCQCCADHLIGRAARKSTKRAWLQTYRSVDHKQARERFRSQVMKRFPDELQDFGNTFVSLQEKRHKADYDPNERFYKSAIIADISSAEAAIEKFGNAEAADRKALSAHVLMKYRLED
ncbi:MAG: hypothetical protein NW205_00675 [Hyphomicrobiaceae bacterium]|nr:hypothetical protein [Hyphomicrobiaceae bacterium]